MGDVIHIEHRTIINCPECGNVYWVVYDNLDLLCVECGIICSVEEEDAETGSPGTDKAS